MKGLGDCVEGWAEGLGEMEDEEMREGRGGGEEWRDAGR